MLLSRLDLRRTLVGVTGTGALAGAMLFGGASSASAEPPPPPAPPGCSAGDLAQVSGTVGTAMAGYLFTHPEVNDFFTSLRGLPNEELRGDVRNYMDAHPQVIVCKVTTDLCRFARAFRRTDVSLWRRSCPDR